MLVWAVYGDLSGGRRSRRSEECLDCDVHNLTEIGWFKPRNKSWTCVAE